MAPIVETPIHKKCTMQCKKNKYETVIILSLIMKPNKYLMNNAIVIVPSNPNSPTNIHRFLCRSSHLAQSHQSDNPPPFFGILTSRTHSVRRAGDTDLDCSHSSSHPSRRLAPRENQSEHHNVCTSSIELIAKACH